MTIFTERITIIRPTKVPGKYGGTEDDWDNPTEIPVDTPVSIQPATTTEDENHKSHLTTANYTGYSQPPNLIEDLRATDRIRIDTWPGTPTYAVNGNPAQWRSIMPHTEFTLEEIHGAQR